MSQARPDQTEKLLYTAKIHTMGGREKGSARSSDGRLDVKLSVPGAPGLGTNPEQLLAAGWSACFESAMALEARRTKVALPPDLAIDAEVDLNLGGDGYFLRARLDINLPGLDRATARTLVDAAHRTCPYSKAMRGNVDVAITLVRPGAVACSPSSERSRPQGGAVEGPNLACRCSRRDPSTSPR